MHRALQRVLLLGLAALLVAPVAWLAHMLLAQRLQVARVPGGYAFDVQWLGEYDASLSSITIVRKPSGQVVWQARPAEASMSVRNFTVLNGENPRVLTGLHNNPTIVVSTPAVGSQLLLQPGAKYSIRVVAGGWLGGLCVPGFNCRTIDVQL